MSDGQLVELLTNVGLPATSSLILRVLYVVRVTWQCVKPNERNHEFNTESMHARERERVVVGGGGQRGRERMSNLEVNNSTNAVLGECEE